MHAESAGRLDENGFFAWRREWHAQQLKRISARTASSIVTASGPGSSTPNALQATPVGPTKMVAEMPAVRATLSHKATSITRETSEWADYASDFTDDAQLDQGSVSLIVAKNPQMAMRMTVSKGSVENPMMRMLRNLSRSIAEDTAQNEYGLHRVIHEWMARDQAPGTFDELNERIYAELFLTPSSDPWLGLAPPDTYTALDNEGLSQAGAPLRPPVAGANPLKQQLQESAQPVGQ
jgi:hypothetical protein